VDSCSTGKAFVTIERNPTAVWEGLSTPLGSFPPRSGTPNEPNEMNETLSVNSKISHYRIVSKLGAGGMGEVYLATDDA